MPTATAVTTARAGTESDLTHSGASLAGLWSLPGAGINVALARANTGSAVTFLTCGSDLANGAIVCDGRGHRRLWGCAPDGLETSAPVLGRGVSVGGRSAFGWHRDHSEHPRASELAEETDQLCL